MSRQHHYLKTHPKYYIAPESGKKTFEVRFNDRNFKEYDILHLQEFVPPETYTGRVMQFEVTYVLDNPDFCKKGYVVLGIKPF